MASCSVGLDLTATINDDVRRRTSVSYDDVCAARGVRWTSSTQLRRPATSSDGRSDLSRLRRDRVELPAATGRRVDDETRNVSATDQRRCDAGRHQSSHVDASMCRSCCGWVESSRYGHLVNEYVNLNIYRLSHDHKTSQQRRMVFVIVHDLWTSLADIWTLLETSCCLAELMSYCFKLTAHGTQNFAIALTSSPSATTSSRCRP